ncbi:gephyrin-like molybdotransferase Glp [Parvularcula marina]|uniref:molybdopterin molybdotransferase MoeA n=1 Tax=Parvularcula marina TaxID=2292771 RepID=UPI003514A406
MLSVDEALKILLDGAGPLGEEEVPVGELVGRVISSPVHARLTQPPFRASAMDGYAVRHTENMGAENNLHVIGEAAAGAPFDRPIGPGEAVRIFTGGVVPEGADHVVIQEDVSRSGDQITITAPQPKPANIRPAGIDFHEGDLLAEKGVVCHALHPSLFAAANLPAVIAYRLPRVALFANGDELKAPGSNLRDGEIVNSNHYSLSAMMKNWGAEPHYLGCAADDPEAIAAVLEKGKAFDLIVPIGGASVGDRDFVKQVFRDLGGEMIFEKVAVKPGKPVWHGMRESARVVGLPGNPASALVTAILFIRPLLNRLLGRQESIAFRQAPLTSSLKPNGPRESYLRAEFKLNEAGQPVITPAGNQDSSLLLPFANSNALIRRQPHAAEGIPGEYVDYLPIF